MPQLLPLVPSLPSYRFGTLLAGEEFIIDVRWNGREGAWYFDVLAKNEAMLAAGMKIVLGSVLGGRNVPSTFPAGAFIAADLSGAGREAGFDDMGVRVQVYFYAQSEIDALAEEAEA